LFDYDVRYKHFVVSERMVFGMVEKVKDGTIGEYKYDPETAKLLKVNVNG